MRDSSFDRYIQASLEAQYAIDQISSRFESAWREGQEPVIEDYLDRIPVADQPALFQELLILDLAYRERQGRLPAWETYGARFPAFAAIVREVFDEEAKRRGYARSGLDAATETTALLASTPRPSSSATLPTRRLPGVPGYEVLAEIGRGGMGIVYKARDIRLNRLVAIKMIMAGDFASEHHLVRFLVEGETLARLHHPNIVQVHEAGQHEGRPYLALEYVEGITLSDRLKQSPLAPRTAAILVERLALAMHYAHQEGIVHRDLKPANILLKRLQEDGDAGAPPNGSSFLPFHPMITDFGLARGLNLDVSLTETGVVLGTPSYMAPEQAQNSKRLGPAVDVYGLGAIFYEMLAGHPPFRADSPMQTIHAVVQHEPPRLSKSGRSIPADLETVCLKCLEKDPSRRYATAEALAKDLARWRNDEPVTARPVTRSERIRQWARRNPLPAVLAATLFLSLICGLGGTSTALFYALRGWHEADDQRAKAEQARGSAELRHKEAQAAQNNAETQSYFSAIAQARLEWQLNNLDESEAVLDHCDPARRGWEWHYLKGIHHSDRLTLKGHAPYVCGLAYSPDRRYLASAGGGIPYYVQESPRAIRPGEVKLWDADSGELVRTLTGHGNVVAAVAFHPDSRHLAAIDLDGKIVVWETATGNPVQTLQVGQRSNARVPSAGLAFSPDGHRLAAFLVEDFTRSTVRVWDVTPSTADAKPAFKPGASIAWNESPFGNLSFTPDSRYILGGLHSQCLWEAANGREVRRWPARGTPYLSPDGKQLANLSDRDVELRDPESGQLLNVLSGHQATVNAVAFSRDGLFLATGGADKSIHVWDLTTLRRVRTFRGHHGRVSCLAFDPDGRYLVSGDQQPGEIKVWELARPQGSDQVAGHLTQNVGFARGSRYLLQACKDGLEVWDLATQSLVREAFLDSVPLEVDYPTTLSAFSAQGSRLALVTKGRASVQVWDLEAMLEAPSNRETTPGLLATLGGLKFPIAHVALSADGRFVAAATSSAANEREVAAWDVAKGQRMVQRTPSGSVSKEPAGQVALSPDGRFLAYDDDAPRPLVRIVEIATGRDLAMLNGHEGLLGSLHFSPDGRVLATAERGGRILIWDTQTWVRRDFSPLQGPANLEHLSISPNGRLLASANREEVVVWDLSLGLKVLVLHGQGPRSADEPCRPRIAWSPDGLALAVINSNDTISLWRHGPLLANTPEDRVAEASRSFDWHVRSAQQSWPEGKYRGLLLHTSILAGLTPADAHQQLRRGVLLARVGRWQEARRDYLAAFEPMLITDPLRWVELGMLHLKAGDLDAYQRLRDRAEALFATPIDRHKARALATLELLGPPAAGQARGPTSWVRQWVDLSDDSPMAQAFLGLDDHRQGQSERTVRYLEDQLRGDRFNESSRMGAHLVLALAYRRLNQEELARKSRDEAERLLREITKGVPPEMPDGVVSVHAIWHWLPLQILRDEVDAALR